MPALLSGTEEDVSKAADLLRSGALVVFPTETVYGLGGDATNDRAVAAIFAAKGRPSFNPLITHLADSGQAAELAVVGELGTRAKIAGGGWGSCSARSEKPGRLYDRQLGQVVPLPPSRVRYASRCCWRYCAVARSAIHCSTSASVVQAHICGPPHHEGPSTDAFSIGCHGCSAAVRKDRNQVSHTSPDRLFATGTRSESTPGVPSTVRAVAILPLVAIAHGDLASVK